MLFVFSSLFVIGGIRNLSLFFDDNDTLPRLLAIHGGNQKYNRTDCKKLQADHATIQDPNGGVALHTKRTLTHPSFDISLLPQEIDRVRWSIMQSGNYYEKFITQDFQDILKDYKKPSLVIDVGMNIGWFSLWTRSLGHYTISFEPNPINRMRLCESLQLNNWTDTEVQVYPYGLGEKEETLEFIMSRRGNPGAGGLKKDFDTEKSVPVQIITLDDFAESQGWFDKDAKVDPIPILKVDVEGHDPHVLRGADRLITSGLIRNVLMEYSCSLSDRTDMDGMVKQLLKASFHLYKIGQWNGAAIEGAKEVILEHDDRSAEAIAERLHQFCKKREQEKNAAQLNLWWKLT
jgi:FkbM family methyltransferase